MDNKPQKILLIRMLGLGDVTSIGLPALRHFQAKFPEAQVDFLTYAAGQEILQLGSPQTQLLAIEKEEWPDDLLQAMEVFLGLAEQIIPKAYDLIVNLDTWFMPCLLARFLKDAGEPVQGNMMSMSVQQLLHEFQHQVLQPDYVNNTANYLQSSWFSMARWHTPWWQSEYLPELGYPEFYLKNCCSFDDIQLDMSIDVTADPKLAKVGQSKKVIALATDARTAERHYPFGIELKRILNRQGYHVWSGFDGSIPMRQTLAQLKSSDLLVTIPSAPQWLATSVGCPSLVICGEVDPRTLMPDYATEQSPSPIPAAQLAESINSIFIEAQQ